MTQVSKRSPRDVFPLTETWPQNDGRKSGRTIMRLTSPSQRPLLRLIVITCMTIGPIGSFSTNSPKENSLPVFPPIWNISFSHIPPLCGTTYQHARRPKNNYVGWFVLGQSLQRWRRGIGSVVLLILKDGGPHQHREPSLSVPS